MAIENICRESILECVKKGLKERCTDALIEKGWKWIGEHKTIPEELNNKIMDILQDMEMEKGVRSDFFLYYFDDIEDLFTSIDF